MSQTLDPLTFPLRGRRLIEASAGTGKTFTLALLYVRLVLGHGTPETAVPRPLLPPEILVVTFTEAATQELRDRIRRRLVEAAGQFGAPDAADDPTDPLARLRADYPPERWPDCARRLQLAADWMDEAAIATIHSWCNRMLAEHAFATRGTFEAALVTDQTERIAETIRDYWRVHCYGLTEAQAAEVLKIVSSPEALRQRLRGWLQRRETPLSYRGVPLPPEPEPRTLLERHAAALADGQAAEDQARAIWRADGEGLAEILRTLRPHLDGRKHESASVDQFDALLDAIADWSRGGPAPGKLANFAAGAFVFKKTAKLRQAPPHPAFDALAVWRTRVDALAPPEAIAAQLLAHAAHWVGRELARRLRYRAELGFDDLLRQLDAALDPERAGVHAGRLAATVRQQFPAILIDEFQDTDPIQYRIFDRIQSAAAPDGGVGTLVTIGDPKQAIYAFRGADIHAYLAASAAAGDGQYTLDTNFRSTPALVSATNRLFGHAERQPRAAFRLRDPSAPGNVPHPIPFRPVNAAASGPTLILDGQPVPAMTCWTLANPADANAPVGTGDYRARMAAVAATRIGDWLRQARAGQAGWRDGADWRPLTPRDLAVLVRDHKEATALRRALTARGIPSVFLSDRQSVFETAEAHDLRHWLRACAAPADEALVRAALGTNTLALPLTELARWRQDELAWEEQVARFAGYRRIWWRQGVLAMLRQLLQDTALPARLLARADGERILTNVLHLAEWLQQAAAALDGEQALIRHLTEHLDQTGDEFVLRLESDAERIRVVTIHKSKGLEYPLVLLPFICGWRAIDGKVREVLYRQGGTAMLEIAGKDRFPDAWDQAHDTGLSEDLRLLYVALTRARQAVWLGIAPLKQSNAKQPQLERSALGYLLAGGAAFPNAAAVWTALETARGGAAEIVIAPAPEASQRRLGAAAAPALAEARVPTQRLAGPRWWVASYSALRTEAAPAALDDGGEPDDPAARPTLPADTAAQDTALEERALDVAAGTVWRGPVTPAAGLHGLPRGSQYGTFLHGLLEWAARHRDRDASGQRRRGFAAALHGTAARQALLQQRCARRGLDGWAEALDAWLAELLERSWALAPLPGASRLRLAELAPARTQVELEFWLESRAVTTTALDRLVRAAILPGQARPALAGDRLDGLLKGFIDLAFEHEGRYYIVDWKSNWLGPDDAAYTAEAMRAAILEHRYDLQYSLYLLALHRQLAARLPDYDYDRHLGGAIYVFLRGTNAPSQGLYLDCPPRGLIEALDRQFAGREAPHRR